ncbi:MAG: DUF4214 domain-containing protein [Clostridiales bacterium]|nr:DUF4214 domain-containing protein [Clostridiales bacterium]
MNIKKTVSSLLAVTMILPIVFFAGMNVNAAGTSKDFVNRIYKYILQRDPDEKGLNYWTSELDNKKVNGGSLAKSFLVSEEFTKKSISNKQYVTILYNTFFGREPDESGLKYWEGNLNDGKNNREQVANGFINSQEWADICAEYNIISGGNKKPSKPMSATPNDKTKAFTERLYTCALERSSDQSGLDYWSKKLASFEVTGEEAAAEFLLGSEIKKANLSDAQFLYRLYQTFLGRVPDLEGYDYWLDYMKKHPEDKFQKTVYAFSRSQEFIQICDEANILPYAG